MQLKPYQQDELFLAQELDTRKEFILFKKFAVKRLIGWQDWIALRLAQDGDYTFDIGKLQPEFCEEQELLWLGYTIITPTREDYQDNFHSKLIKRIKIKFSMPTKPAFDKIILDIKF